MANSGSGDVSVYQIGTGTGVLSSGTAVLAGTVPQSVTVDPTGRFAYVANQGVTDGFGVSAGDISAYTIGGGGALTPVNCGSGPGCNGANFQAGNNTKSVIVDPSGKFVYAVNLNSSDISAYTIDNAPTTGTGALTSVGATVATGLKPSSITVDHTGKFAYVANADENSVSAYTINATTGALTQILCSVVGGVCETVLSGTGDNFLAGAGPQSVTVDPTSKFVYVANATDNTVSAYSIDAVSGVLTPIDAIPSTVGVIDNFAAGTTPTSVAVDPSGNYAYVANNGSGDVSAYAITTTGPTAGALSPIACVTSATIACSASNFFTAGMGPTSIAVDLLGQAVYVANITSNDISAYTITTGGVLAFIDAAPGGAIDNFPAGNAPASVTTATIQ